MVGIDLTALVGELDGYCAALIREAALTSMRDSLAATEVTAAQVTTAAKPSAPHWTRRNSPDWRPTPQAIPERELTQRGRSRRILRRAEMDKLNTASQTAGMTVKLGISLSDETHAAIAAAAKAEGLPLSTFVDRVLAREIFRRGVDDHNDMLREAGLADPDRLRTRIDARQQSIGEWKAAHRSAEGGIE